jgi:hypothetical protein
MNDTTPDMTKKMCEMIQKKTPAERLKMGWSMYETSKQMVTRAILKSNPTISDSDLRQELFLKFYFNDFDSEKQKKILQHFANLDK